MLLRSHKHSPWEAQAHAVSFQVLCILLQHPAACSSHETVRSLAQTCKAVRQALQQSTAGSMAVSTFWLQQRNAVPTIKAFADWLAKYPGLVGEIELGMPCVMLHSSSAQNKFRAAAETAMCRTFLAAAATPPAAAARPCLALKAFSCNLYRRPQLLEALPAPSLTRLSLAHTADDWSYAAHSSNSSGSPAALQPPRVAAALARLTSLRELELSERNSSGGLPTDVPEGVDPHAYGKLDNACLAAIGSLSGLTQLSIECTAPAADLTLLPVQLLELELTAQCSSSRRSSSELVLSLGHLTRLLQLGLTVFGSPAAGSSLPSQLTQLSLWVRGDSGAQDLEASDMQHLHITALQQLQQLELSDALCQPDQLQQLTCLSKLQELSLEYTSAACACRAGPAWCKLSCLHSLELRDNKSELSLQEGRQLLAAIGAATSLVELQLSADDASYDSNSLLDERSDICKYFTGLQQLTYLHLDNINGPHKKKDALHLTKLKNLADLSLRSTWSVDNATAIAIARSLTQLTSLELRDCLITRRAVLQEIAQLPLLEVLDISENTEWADDCSRLEDVDLEVLLSLPNLQDLFAEGTFTEEAVERFWDVYYSQRSG